MSSSWQALDSNRQVEDSQALARWRRWSSRARPRGLWRVRSRYSASAAPSPVMRVSLLGPNHSQSNLSAATEWAEEFADLTSADAALHPDTAEGREAYKRDFWKSLEDDWKEAAEADHPWLNEFSSTYEPFKDYQVIKIIKITSSKIISSGRKTRWRTPATHWRRANRGWRR